MIIYRANDEPKVIFFQGAGFNVNPRPHLELAHPPPTGS